MASRPTSVTRLPDSLCRDGEEVMVMTAGPLRVTVRFERDLRQSCVELSGELDLAGASLAELVLRRAERGDVRVVLIDLSALHFIDVSGLRLVLAAEERTRRRGQRLFLLRPPPEAFQVFALTGAEERLTFLD
jgi:anti-anti-sigma factor